MLTKYLDMYASDESVELSELQLKALDRLYEIGYENGVFSEPMKTEDYLIPREYEALRNG
jgi:1,4-dihydroxy-6-naphthoate synthase